MRRGTMDCDATSKSPENQTGSRQVSSLAGTFGTAAVEAVLRFIMEGTDDAIVCCTREGKILTWNRGAEELFGYSAGEAVGKQFVCLMAPDGVEAAAGLLIAAAEGYGGRRDAVVLCKGARTIEASLTLQPILTPGRETVAVCSILRNNSAEREKERDLTASRDRLRLLAARVEDLREQERSRVAREIHDELGQMLMVLRMDIELAVAQVTEGAPAAGILHRLAQATQHLQRSVSAAKKVSAELHPAVLDHVGLTAAMEMEGRDFKSRTGIACSIPESPAELPLEPARATAVFRIFQEILTNVERHSGASHVAVHIRMDDTDLVLKVRDNGQGFAAAELEDSGSLGLCWMRERASALGGVVEFGGGPGQGTTVTLRVPFNSPVTSPIQDLVDPAHDHGTTDQTSTHPVRILLIDDHTIFRKGLKECLRGRLEATYGEAETVEAAEAAIRSQPWDLIVLDIAMPGKSGLVLLRELRAAGSQVPVIVVSTHAEEQYGPIALKSGGNGYVCKSQPTDDLVAGIQAVLAGGSCFSAVTLRAGGASPSEQGITQGPSP